MASSSPLNLLGFSGDDALQLHRSMLTSNKINTVQLAGYPKSDEATVPISNRDMTASIIECHLPFLSFLGFASGFPCMAMDTPNL